MSSSEENSSSDSDTEPTNTDVNRYYHNKVELCQTEVRDSVEVVVPIVEKLVKEVSRQDPRFSKDVLKTGSYYQGLKICKADEFDFNVLLNIEDTFVKVDQTRRYYGFNRQIEDPAVSLADDIQVIRSKVPLPDPPVGHESVSYDDREHVIWKGIQADMLMDGDIIPFLVKKRFKQLLVQAIRDLDLRGIVSKSRWIHGPAVTVTVRHPDLPHSVQVDFCVAIILEMDSEKDMWPSGIKWPWKRGGKKGLKWPSKEKIDRIKQVGIEHVAKRNFDWRFGFVRAENILIEKIDQDGGCRKKVQRIMKKLNEDVWCNTSKKVITSYCLKTLLFWECEKYHPKSSDWHMDNISARLMEMVQHLRDAVQVKRLPHYFVPAMNVFEAKNEKELDIALVKIDKFLENPKDFLVAVEE